MLFGELVCARQNEVSFALRKNNNFMVYCSDMQKPLRKVLDIVIVAVVAVLLLGSGVWLGWTAGRKVPETIQVQGVANINGASTTDADFSTFWQAWQLINDNYLRNPSTTDEEKVQGAINGLVNSLGDPYSEYFTPSANQEFQQDITGDFGGIGAELGTDPSGDIVIIAPLKGTPAATAGLKPEDIIETINGSSTEGMTVDEVVDLIRGNPGTQVTLGILRSGWKAPQDFTITRQDITVPDVTLTMKGDIADIELDEFTQDSDQAFYTALTQALNQNAKGIVLDLRDDPGGYLEVAVDIAGYFLKPGALIVKEIGRTVPEQDYHATGDGSLDNFPMVILINNGSASAAEILSGALNDDRNIPLVGERSFGKGTVQELEPLSDGSAIKLTVAHWVLPSGRILDYDGLQPNYAVPITDAQVAAGQDPQLAEAMTVLQDEINGTPLPPQSPSSTAATATSTSIATSTSQ
jgi:carboxyl-terminal processing protease